jgi:hypothetical protein
MNQVFEMPPTMKIADWQSLVSSMMQNMNEIEVPEELTYKGQFVSHLESFCTGRVQAQSPEEISLGKPFTEEGKVYFKLEALIKYLRNQKFEAYNRGQIQERLKELNPDGTANAHRKFKTTKGEWKSFRVWWVPEFMEEVEVPSIEIREQEVPF